MFATIIKNFSFLLQEFENTNIIDNLQSSQKAFLIFLLSQKNKDILVISQGKKRDELFSNLSFFKKDILEFDSSNLKNTIFPLLKIFKNKKHITLTSLEGTFQKIPSQKEIENSIITWKIKENIAFSKISKLLLSLNYERKEMVEKEGEFAIRGGIIDIFSPIEICPIRIEFFENTIESLRYFDPISQRSIEKRDQITICAKFSFFKKTSYLLDILKDPIIIFEDIETLEDAYINLKSLSNYKKNHFLSLKIFFEKIKNFKKFFLEENSLEKTVKTKILKNKNKQFYFLDTQIICKKIKSPFLPISFFSQDDQNYPYSQIKEILAQNFNTIFLYEKEIEQDFIKKKLLENNINLKKINFQNGYLSSGFVVVEEKLAVIPYFEFSYKKKIRRQKQQIYAHMPVSSFSDLQKGDIVVHTYSGIGKFLYIEKQKDYLGKESEFLVLEYGKNSKLYVPLSQSYLISKYIGSKEEKPNLDILGSSKWKKKKNYAQKNIEGYAKELLHLYAQRSQKKKTVYPKDSKEFHLFENGFEYEETFDQLQAISDIKKDMTLPKPMERLVCGDVGYGKTEVAMRAAFKAAFDGQVQVAILVPTTILALQHLETFRKRMLEFPIQIEAISRFNSKQTNEKILQDTKKGKVDILIGTHRILSKDVFFKNLGLVIIDEEQRFGVRAKEHLKQFVKDVDCISFSATPIPRTLYLSLIKIRDISIINTPPQDRLPITTILIENNDETIKNAILTELARDGQIFFIHNRIESIERRKNHIASLAAHAKILKVHGQMKPFEIDTVFHKFKQKQADILISTNIVENGVDIPNCNTIIIDHADNFGLSDLYQLRGRVGRWNKKAFCYLVIAKNKKLSKIASLRLNSLLKATSLASGIKIAIKDLEIRGAGDILGEKQSGHIFAIGFHLYCKLLKKAIVDLKKKRPINFEDTKMEFSYPAYIPANYIKDANIKMSIYHKIGKAISFEEIDDIAIELKDRFGSFPIEVLWLLNLFKIKIFASNNNFSILRFEKHILFTKHKKREKIISLPIFTQKDPTKLKEFVIEKLKNIL